MFALGSATRVFLKPGATDMRMGFNGLYALAECHPRKDQPPRLRFGFVVHCSIEH